MHAASRERWKDHEGTKYNSNMCRPVLENTSEGNNQWFSLLVVLPARLFVSVTLNAVQCMLVIIHNHPSDLQLELQTRGCSSFTNWLFSPPEYSLPRHSFENKTIPPSDSGEQADCHTDDPYPCHFKVTQHTARFASFYASIIVLRGPRVAMHLRQL